MAFSLPPLAAVVFYIHIQRLAKDYKEMATAITAAILCILHVLRTLWGLLQLRAFKDWNVHALQVLTRMGMEPPIELRQKMGITFSDICAESEWTRSHGYSHSRIFKIFLLFIAGVGKLPGMQNMYQFAEGTFGTWFATPRGSSRAALIETIIDEHMMVNSSLVDNEFNGADLPSSELFVPSLSMSKGGLSAAHFLTSTEPEECAVRWLVSFLCRFGSEWLTYTEKALDGESEHRNFEADNLLKKLVLLIVFSVTYRMEKDEDDGTQSSEAVSLISPLQMLCSDLSIYGPLHSKSLTNHAYLIKQQQEANSKR